MFKRIENQKNIENQLRNFERDLVALPNMDFQTIQAFSMNYGAFFENLQDLKHYKQKCLLLLNNHIQYMALLMIKVNVNQYPVTTEMLPLFHHSLSILSGEKQSEYLIALNALANSLSGEPGLVCLKWVRDGHLRLDQTIGIFQKLTPLHLAWVANRMGLKWFPTNEHYTHHFTSKVFTAENYWEYLLETYVKIYFDNDLKKTLHHIEILLTSFKFYRLGNQKDVEKKLCLYQQLSINCYYKTFSNFMQTLDAIKSKPETIENIASGVNYLRLWLRDNEQSIDLCLQFKDGRYYNNFLLKTYAYLSWLIESYIFLQKKTSVLSDYYAGEIPQIYDKIISLDAGDFHQYLLKADTYYSRMTWHEKNKNFQAAFQDLYEAIALYSKSININPKKNNLYHTAMNEILVCTLYYFRLKFQKNPDFSLLKKLNLQNFLTAFDESRKDNIAALKNQSLQPLDLQKVTNTYIHLFVTIFNLLEPNEIEAILARLIYFLQRYLTNGRETKTISLVMTIALNDVVATIKAAEKSIKSFNEWSNISDETSQKNSVIILARLMEIQDNLRAFALFNHICYSNAPQIFNEGPTSKFMQALDKTILMHSTLGMEIAFEQCFLLLKDCLKGIESVPVIEQLVSSAKYCLNLLKSSELYYFSLYFSEFFITQIYLAISQSQEIVFKMQFHSLESAIFPYYMDALFNIICLRDINDKKQFENIEFYCLKYINIFIKNLKHDFDIPEHNTVYVYKTLHQLYLQCNLEDNYENIIRCALESLPDNQEILSLACQIQQDKVRTIFQEISTSLNQVDIELVKIRSNKPIILLSRSQAGNPNLSSDIETLKRLQKQLSDTASAVTDEHNQLLSFYNQICEWDIQKDFSTLSLAKYKEMFKALSLKKITILSISESIASLLTRRTEAQKMLVNNCMEFNALYEIEFRKQAQIFEQKKINAANANLKSAHTKQYVERSANTLFSVRQNYVAALRNEEKWADRLSNTHMLVTERMENTLPQSKVTSLMETIDAQEQLILSLEKQERILALKQDELEKKQVLMDAENARSAVNAEFIKTLKSEEIAANDNQLTMARLNRRETRLSSLQSREASLATLILEKERFLSTLSTTKKEILSKIQDEIQVHASKPYSNPQLRIAEINERCFIEALDFLYSMHQGLQAFGMHLIIYGSRAGKLAFYCINPNPNLAYLISTNDIDLYIPFSSNKGFHINEFLKFTDFEVKISNSHYISAMKRFKNVRIDLTCARSANYRIEVFIPVTTATAQFIENPDGLENVVQYGKYFLQIFVPNENLDIYKMADKEFLIKKPADCFMPAYGSKITDYAYKFRLMPQMDFTRTANPDPTLVAYSQVFPLLICYFTQQLQNGSDLGYKSLANLLSKPISAALLPWKLPYIEAFLTAMVLVKLEPVGLLQERQAIIDNAVNQFKNAMKFNQNYLKDHIYTDINNFVQLAISREIQRKQLELQRAYNLLCAPSAFFSIQSRNTSKDACLAENHEVDRPNQGL